MIITEAEARSVLCPMLFNLATHDGTGGVAGPGCLGSGCMAWRWENPNENIRIDGLPDDAYRSQDLLDPRGYCGLAGPIVGGSK